ncbi:MAG: NuoF family protein [Blastocatellia bacterium]|nr:NuoF family protein [Blastocatellia bacterium]
MTIEELEEIARSERDARPAHSIDVCVAASCLSCGGDEVRKALAAETAGQADGPQCRVRGVGCLGLCSAGPLVAADEQLYRQVKPEDAAEIAGSLGGAPIERLRCATEIPFFTRQNRIVLENSGRIDPERIEDYIAADGYRALVTALAEMDPGEVGEQVSLSGLRGRGGGGYPTGLKWATVAKAQGPLKYVVCNADEGDPGAFMDRSVLESDPHRVLEGMALAAYAVGASEGYIYARAEYPLAVSRLQAAIRQAERLGLLGKNICATTFSFHVEVRIGAGAFVCGEETALLSSIEGNRGTPRPRPPYPAEEGLWGRPTLINNVETFANIAPIIRNGGAWFASIGTARSKGTKVFALAGRVRNTGLIEVPMGITLREIIYEIGGGIPEDRGFKAVQTGGPSGGCIPEAHLEMPVDYESLAGVGSIMGSGGMIVMDESACMVDVAKYFMEICMTESCGKCVPCRVGTVHLHEALRRICEGVGTAADLARLEELGEMVKQTSLCGLGQSAPNPIFSTLRFFRDEYLAHLTTGPARCPAGICVSGEEPAS